MKLEKLYLIPFLLWFPIYWIYFLCHHSQYPVWVLWMGSFIGLTSEIVLFAIISNINLRKPWILGLNLINFVWYLYYLPTDVSGVNGNLEWTIVFTIIDIVMIVLSFDNLMHLYHRNNKSTYNLERISRHMLVVWYLSLTTLFLIRYALYARK